MNEVDIVELARKATAGLLEITAHANDRLLERQISLTELRQALVAGQVIETYPADHYWPSCLVLGLTIAGRPLHVVCTYPTRPLVKIITAYEPNAAQWLSDFKSRRL